MNQNLIVALLVFSALVLIFLIYRQQILKNELKNLQNQLNKLEEENKLLEAEKLKFQLQPHTLNNLFAQMKSFANRLNKGMESLSLTLEYVFYKGGNHFVTVEDEIHFIKKYLELNDLFLTEVDAVKFEVGIIPNEVLNSDKKQIPHLITAYFLENAFKHGDKTHPEFLKVKVNADERMFQLNVVNKIKPSAHIKTNKGIGLENMKKRLNIFSPNRYTITNSCNENEYHSNLTIYFPR